MTDSDLIEKQTRKLRRRIEDFLRHTSLAILIRIADICGISVAKALRNKKDEK